MTSQDSFDNPSLDSIKNNRNKNFCGKWSVAGRIELNGKKVNRFARLGCKKWTCPNCGPKRLKQLKCAISKKAQELGLTRFLTLTIDHNSCTPEESVAYIRNCWNKFRVYLKRKHGKSITFIAILEPQKSGHAHLHILVDRYINQKWISSRWSSIGGGPMVDIRQVDVHRISKYITKYITKDLLNENYIIKHRRYTTSRGLRLFEKSLKGTWTLIKLPLTLLLESTFGKIGDIKENDSGLIEWFNVLEPS